MVPGKNQRKMHIFGDSMKRMGTFHFFNPSQEKATRSHKSRCIIERKSVKNTRLFRSLPAKKERAKNRKIQQQKSQTLPAPKNVNPPPTHTSRYLPHSLPAVRKTVKLS